MFELIGHFWDSVSTRLTDSLFFFLVTFHTQKGRGSEFKENPRKKIATRKLHKFLSSLFLESHGWFTYKLWQSKTSDNKVIFSESVLL